MIATPFAGGRGGFVESCVVANEAEWRVNAIQQHADLCARVSDWVGGRAVLMSFGFGKMISKYLLRHLLLRPAGCFLLLGALNREAAGEIELKVRDVHIANTSTERISRLDYRD